MNIDKIIEKAAGQLAAYYQRRYPGKEQPIAAVQEQLLCRVWLKWAGRLGKSKPENTPLRMERTIRSLMREGLEKAGIRYKDGVFRVRLAQGEYILYKVSDQRVYAWPAGIRGARFPIQVDEEAFARFLLAFDAARPEILRRACSVAYVVRKSTIEYRKECLIAQIRNTVGGVRRPRPVLKDISWMKRKNFGSSIIY